MPSRKVKPLRQTGLGKLGVTLQIKQVHDLHVSVIGWRQLELPEGCTSMHYRVHILEAKHPKRVFAQLSQDRPRVSSEFDKFSQLYRPMPDTDLSEVCDTQAAGPCMGWPLGACALRASITLRRLVV